MVQGAEASMTTLPGSPLTALALRGPLPTPPPLGPAPFGAAPLGAGATSMAAEGPGGASGPGVGAAIGSALMSGLPSALVPGGLMGDGGMQASLVQSQQMNLYFIQLQQQVDAENRTFTTVSNVLKTQNDTVKNAIGNIH
jgi:hypothetical protein